MSEIHRFTINVPNPEPKAVTVELGFREASASELRGLLVETPKGRVKIEQVGISLDPREFGDEVLRRRLAAYSSIDVHVTAMTTPPANPELGGMAALHLTDRRGGEEVGGVLLVCADPSMTDAPGREIPTSAPCPVTLGRSLYAVECDIDPSTGGRQAIFAGTSVDLVARLHNPGRRSLTGVTAYLEHLGGSAARFVPATWNIGRLGQFDAFLATWRVNAGAALPGKFEASIVVQATRMDPTRVKAPIRIDLPEEQQPGRRRQAGKGTKT